jgi:hypothetical protein
VKSAKRERGVLRVPVLPAELRAPSSNEPPPHLPVLSTPASRRKRRTPSLGLGVFLGLAFAAVAAIAVALVLAQPSGDHPRIVSVVAVTPPAPAATTTAAGAKPPPVKTPSAPFRAEAVHMPQSLLTAIADSAAVSLSSGVAWTVGGEQGGTPVDAIDQVTLPGGQVTPSGHFEEPLAETGYASQGVTLYMAGGYTGTQYGTAVLRFTPPNGAAALLARLPSAVRGPAVALLDGKLYVAGGKTEAGPTRFFFTVDLATGDVHPLMALPYAVGSGALVPLAGKLYLLTGNSALELSPKNGRMVAAKPLPAELHGAVGLGGPVVVAGGQAYRVRAIP